MRALQKMPPALPVPSYFKYPKEEEKKAPECIAINSKKRKHIEVSRCSDEVDKSIQKLNLSNDLQKNKRKAPLSHEL